MAGASERQRAQGVLRFTFFEFEDCGAEAYRETEYAEAEQLSDGEMAELMEKYQKCQNQKGKQNIDKSHYPFLLEDVFSQNSLASLRASASME